MKGVIFLKLGGSLITNKTGIEEARQDVLARLATEIQQVREEYPQLKLLVGHGSGSFGHVAGAKYGTRQGVRTAKEWAGFAEVSLAASRLNTLVMDALAAAGVPAIRLQPSASAVCVSGKIQSLASRPVEMALQAGLVPVIFGDVAFDRVQGGTIISTEEVMTFLTPLLQPAWLLLAGDTQGVLDAKGQVIPKISNENLHKIIKALGRSKGTDVTGGMVGKVQAMLKLVENHSHLKVRIFSGLEVGNIQKAISMPELASGTVIKSNQA